MNRVNDFNIITFHDAHNHGAVLQTYALQSFIDRMGYSVSVYDYTSPGVGTFRGKLLSASKLLHKKDYRIKDKKFDEYINTKLNLTVDKNCSVFITGSDQVWNPMGLMDSAYFLRSIKYPVVKASYAASLGVSKIPDEKKSVFREYIADFDAISVREEAVKNEISELYAKDIDVHIDPTLLLDKEFWTQEAVEVEGLPKDYIFVYALKNLKNLNCLIDWLKNETGLPVVLIDEQGIIGYQVHHDILLRNIGPQEFIWLIKNAQSVISTSFHGTAFSLIFEKELYAVVNPSAPSRISNLLNLCGIECVDIKNTNYRRHLDIDWKNVHSTLNAERKKSSDYIQNIYMLAQSRRMQINDVRWINSACTGCGCCEAVCNNAAIEIGINSEGFYEPKLNDNNCIRCGLCLSKCPVNCTDNFEQKRICAYSAFSLSKEIIFNSSSGGVFRTLADQTLKNGGVVVGAVFSDDFREVYLTDSDESEIIKMQKSKYVACDPNHIYVKVKSFLDSQRAVLFTGLPCQVAGLKSYLGKEYSTLFTVDFVCGGVPSARFYNDHLDELQRRFNSVIKNVDFRNKQSGWKRSKLRVSFSNHKKYDVKHGFSDSYINCFGREHISVNEPCVECIFRNKHLSDITIADFWGYKAAGLKINDDGMSLIVVNTENGLKHIDDLSGELNMLPVDMKTTDYNYQPHKNAYNIKKKRNVFFSTAESVGFEQAASKLITTHVFMIAGEKIKSFLRRK